MYGKKRSIDNVVSNNVVRICGFIDCMKSANMCMYTIRHNRQSYSTAQHQSAQCELQESSSGWRSNTTRNEDTLLYVLRLRLLRGVLRATMARASCGISVSAARTHCQCAWRRLFLYWLVTTGWLFYLGVKLSKLFQVTIFKILCWYSFNEQCLQVKINRISVGFARFLSTLKQ